MDIVPRDKDKLAKIGFAVLLVLALLALGVALTIDDLPEFGFGD